MARNTNNGGNGGGGGGAPISFAELAMPLHQNGYSVIPIAPKGFTYKNAKGEIKTCGGKGPIEPGWSKITDQTAEYVQGLIKKRPTWGLGLLQWNTAAWDVDVFHQAAADEIHALAVEWFGPLLTRYGRAPRRMLVGRADQPFKTITGAKFTMPGDLIGVDKFHSVQLRCMGDQFVAYGIHPDTGQPYYWDGASPLTVKQCDLPVIDPEKGRQFIKEAEAILERHGGVRVKDLREEGEGAPKEGPHELRARDPAKAREWIKAIPNEGGYDDWVYMALVVKGALGEDGYVDFLEWSKKSELHHHEDSVRTLWNSVNPERIGAATLKFLAIKSGWMDEAKTLEDRLALQFAEAYAPKFRYVAKWGRWHIWNGAYWKKDDTFEVWNAIRDFVRDYETKINEAKKARGDNNPIKIVRVKILSSIETMVKADRRLASTPEQWDANDWLLNTPDGIVDLRTGNLRAGRPEDYCLKMTSVGPAATADCPMFMDFLNKAMNKDQQLIDYLQRVFGYALTGVTTEQCLQFFYGEGGNGKGVLISTARGIFGTYHRTAPITTFVVSYGSQHPTDLAGLHGARLVTSTETDKGRRWAVSIICSITGGDEISARFMRQDFFDFVPKFKLIISGNFKPVIRSVNEAIIRRFQLLLWGVIISEAKRDTHLVEKLEKEWPAILRFFINGCLEWQRGGLKPPQAVIEATKAYLADEDIVGRWVYDWCRLDTTKRTAAGSCYSSFEQWCELAGEPVPSQKEFSQTLAKHEGVTADRDHYGRGFIGIEILDEEKWKRRDEEVL